MLPMLHRTFFLPALAALLLAACASEPPGPVAAQTPAGAPARQDDRPPQPSPAPAPPAPPEVQKSRLDHLQIALTDALKGQDVEVIRQAKATTLLLRIPGTMAFAANDAKPQPALLTLLDKLAEALKREPSTQATIEGHTDSLGREVFNQTLSIRRADQVVAYLASKGIAYGRLNAVGKGESQPIADNATETGRARNRRVDILIRSGQ